MIIGELNTDEIACLTEEMYPFLHVNMLHRWYVPSSLHEEEDYGTCTEESDMQPVVSNELNGLSWTFSDVMKSKPS